MKSFRKLTSSECIWLIENTYMVGKWSDQVVEFIKKHPAAKDFLRLNMISEIEIYNQIKSYELKL